MISRILICLIFFNPGLLLASDKILIHIHLFRADKPSEAAGATGPRILTAANQPEVAVIKAKAGGSDTEVSAATLEALLDIYDLTSIEDLFLHRKWWDGTRLYDLQWDGNARPGRQAFVRPFDLILGGSTGFGIRIVPKIRPDERIDLQVVVYRTRKNASLATDMEVIADHKLDLGIADPAIIEWPCENGSYLMMAMLTIEDPALRKAASVKEQPEPRFVPALKALTQVQPLYPEELRNRLIGGQIGLRITIDEKGIVRRVDVEKPVHPYLDYAAVQAFSRWAFEPLVLDGKPVPAAFSYEYDFYPRIYAPAAVARSGHQAGLDESSAKELATILSGSAEYCSKLAASALNFICEEYIREIHFDLLKNIGWIVARTAPHKDADGADQFIKIEPDAKPSVWMKYFGASESESDKIRNLNYKDLATVSYIQIMDPKTTRKNTFLCDYLIVKKRDAIDERRIVLKENGKKMPDRSKILEEKRFSGLSSLLAPLRVLAGERQGLFDFRIAGEERVHGRNAAVIEATPKTGHEDAIWSAKFWIDKTRFQTMRCEIEGVPIDAYEEVLNDCVILNVKPIFLTAHEYGAERNGLRYPTKSKVHVAYPIAGSAPVEKLSIQMSYDGYKYFSVTSEPRIVK